MPVKRSHVRCSNFTKRPWIGQQLKFSDHIQNVVKKANRVLGCLARTFRHLNKDTFLLLYKAMVRQRLIYASCVWSSEKETDTSLSKFSGVQHGLCLKNKQQQIQELQLPTLTYRRQGTDAIQTFTIVK